MTAKLLAACGYQGDALNLPVADADASAAFYVGKMGFAEIERGGGPVKRVVLERDGVRMGLAENGGDPEQNGCAFHTDDVAALREEFAASGAGKIGEIKSETREDGSTFDAFFVIAPDGLCFWFGQRKWAAPRAYFRLDGRASLIRRAEKLRFSVRCLIYILRLRRTVMFQISRTNPAYYFTAVAYHRLPIFRTDEVKQVVCNAYAEARGTHGILVLAYVIMPDHVHTLARSERKMADVLRLLNGISARRVIQYLKENNFQSSLLKLRGETRERNHKHSVWHHHSDSLEIFGEETFRQKVDYIHSNPVRSGLVSRSADYRFSSARQWMGRSLENEPLATDHRQIEWRRSRVE